jgi:subtilisin family serine protease/subtilisin-like proprotein convertase family protein
MLGLTIRSALAVLVLLLLTSTLAWGQDSVARDGGLTVSQVAAALAHEHVPGELLVRFEDGVQAAAAGDILAASGSSTIKTYSTVPGLHHIRVSDVAESLLSLSATPGVRYVEPNYRVYAIETNRGATAAGGGEVGTDYTPTDPDFGNLWGLHNTGQTGGTTDADIDAVEGWNVNRTAPSIVVSVIDTGVWSTHEDLAAQMWTNPGEIPGNGVDDDGNGYIDDTWGWDWVNNDNDPTDDNTHGWNGSACVLTNTYHGTHTSGTIGMVEGNGVGGVGVAHTVQIIALKVLDFCGGGDIADAISAVDYSTLMGVDISNNSWGGGAFSQAMMDTITAFGAQGGVFVAAAGNSVSGSDNDLIPHYPSSYTNANLISVASSTDTDARSGFSNWGATSVDLFAPGSSIYSACGGNNSCYQHLNGTSMAAPAVSGAVALYMDQHPGATPSQIRQAVIAAVDVKPAYTGDVVSDGRLNLYNLLSGEVLPPPVLAPEPATTPGTENTIYWSAVSPSAEADSSASSVGDVNPASMVGGDESDPVPALEATSAAGQVLGGAHDRGSQAPAMPSSSTSVPGLDGDVSGTRRQVVPRTPETEHLFAADDRESDGVIIIRGEVVSGGGTSNVESPTSAPGTLAVDYVWWNWSGSLAIPDGPGGAWAGINCNTPSGVPSGSQVTSVTVHHEISHTYIGDLEVKVYNAGGTAWMVRDNEGGSADNINETRTEYGLFDGADPEQEWYYRARDTAAFDTGNLNVMQLYVYYSYDSPQPDLTRSAASINKTTFFPGEQLSVDITVHNQGNASANSGYVYYYWQKGSRSYTSTYKVGEDSYSALSAGGTSPESFSFTVPGNAVPGADYYFYYWVDATGTTTESDENNNRFYFTITVISPTLPDLQAPYFWWSSTEMYEGDANWVRCSVYNGGAGTAGASHVQLYLSTDNDFDVSDDYYVGEKPVGAIAPGGEQIVQWDFDMPDIGSGSYPVWMVCVVDSRDEVPETNENNTWKSFDAFTALDLVEYYAESDDNPSFTSPANSGWIEETQHTFGGLTPGQTYWYRVKARQGGAESGWSNVEHSQQASPGSLQFKSAAYSVAEDGGSVRIYVSRTAGSSGTASVNYATANGSATAGSDYTAQSATLNWSDGDSADKHFDVPIINDSTPEDGEDFTAALSGATGASIGSPSTTTVTIPINDQPVIYTISTSASPPAGGTTSGGGVYNDGDTATVVATANSGYSFVNWTEGGTPVHSSASYSFTVTGHRDLVANFQALYTISTSALPPEGGSTSGGGSYASGSTATVVATANTGYEFVNWTEGGAAVHSSPSYSFTVTDHRTLVANFQDNRTVVDFPDPNLEAKIREAIGKPEGPIYDTDLLGLTTLNGQWAAISDLSGIEYCIDLAVLLLYDNAITDITALAGLTSLNVLELTYNQIDDINALTDLANLEWLELGGNEIDDITVLAGLSNLRGLGLMDNLIDDIVALTNLVSLEQLELRYNQISDLTPLVANTGVGSGDTVDVRENPLTCDSIFSDIPQLEERGVIVDWDDDPACYVDTDEDGVPDFTDNCVAVVNADQADVDFPDDDDSSLAGIQHYGDACDADLDNDGIVGATDFFGVFRPCLGKAPSIWPECAACDFDGDDVVGATDFFGYFRPSLGTAPGPGYTEP